MNYFIFIVFFIIGFIFGIIYFNLKYKVIKGILEVDDINKSYFFKMSEEEIKNKNNNIIIFKIEHKNKSQ